MRNDSKIVKNNHNNFASFQSNLTSTLHYGHFLEFLNQFLMQEE